MSKSMYIVMHGGVKIDADLAKELKLKTNTAPAGTELELDDAFVAQVDPAGTQFITKEQYTALVEQIEANDKAEASIAKMREMAETAEQKLASVRVNQKLIVAARAIEAAKQAPKAEAPTKSKRAKGE